MARFDTVPLAQAWLVVPLLTFGAMQTILMTELRAARQAWLSGAVAIGQLLLNLAGSLVLVAACGFGLTGLLSAQLITGGLVTSLTLWLMRRRLHFRWQPAQIKALLRYGIPMLGTLTLPYSPDHPCPFPPPP